MRTKDEIEKAQEAWDYKAMQGNYRCSVCNMLICYDDRDVYFETKMCGYQAHTESKDD